MKHFYSFTNRLVKSFRGLALVASLVLFAGNVWGASTTIAGGTSGTVTNVLSWTTEQNSGTNATIWSTNHFRFYYHSGGNGGSMTITPVAGITITGFTLTATTTSYTPTVKYNIDGGADVSGTWSSTSMEVTGLSATSSLKFRNANTANKQLRVTVEVTYEAAPSYTITESTNNASWGTVSKIGSVITGSPAPGYGYASPAYTVTSGTATVSQSDNDFTVTPSSNCEVRINFEALPTHTLTWNVNGSTSTTKVVQDDAIGTLPTDPTSADCDNAKVFVGWTTAPYTNASVAPTYISTATVPSANTTYYAVFATEAPGDSGTATDTWTFNATKPTEWDQSGCEAYFSIWTGMKSVNDYIQNKSISDFTNYAGSATNITIGVTSLQNGGTGSRLTVSLVDASGSVLASNIITPVNASLVANATRLTVTFAANSNATGYKIQCTTYDRNVLITGTDYSITYSQTTYSNYTTSCCTAITPTLTYGSYTVLVGNTIAAPNIGGNTGSGTVTYSSSNTSVLTVNSSTGVVTGVGSGTATVTANIAANGGYCAGSATSSTITVTSGCTPAATVWDASTVNKTYGNAAFTNAFLSDNTGAETYASSNTGVATVNSTTGEVTIVGVGTTTISVTQPETGSYCAVSTSYTLNVTCATLATPASFVAGTVAATTIDFSWASVANASSYTLTYTDGGSTLYKTGVAGTSTQLTGLTPSTQYLVTVKAVGNGTTYCNSAESTTADITTTALPSYTLTWNVNGSTSTTSVVQGNAIGTLPTNPTSASCDNVKVFVGWTNAPYTHASVAPTYISTATVPSANTTYYAVFAEGDPGVAVNTVLWAENFAHFGTNTPSDAGTGSGTTIYDNATITYTQSSTSTKAYNEKLAGGTAPELLLTKTGPGTWTISGIKTGGATGMSLTFLSNKTAFSLTSPTTGISITGSATSWTITVTGSVTTFELELGNTNTGANARVDNVELKVTESSSYVNFATSCVACDANTLALTSTKQTINIDGTGYADYDVSTLITSKNGNGAVTYSVTPAAAIIDENTGEFITDTPGTYYVSVIQDLGSEGSPICAKTVNDTIVVLATPVVTIVDVTPLTFTANCGEASVAQSVSVSGYNLTANMTATAPTNFLVSNALDGTYDATATFTQASGTASGTLYIKANPPAASTDPISGNVTLTSTDATTRTLAVSATVSCTPVTVTFLDWDGNSTVWNTFYSGSTQTLPAPTTGACAGWTFSGWTTNNLTAISAGDIVGTTGASLTLTGSTTYYAVYTQGGGTSTIFSDDFADLVSAKSIAIASRPNWSSLSRVYPEVGYVKLGSSSAKGVATTVLMSELTGAGTLTFDLQAFGSDTKDIIITVNQGTITEATTAKSKTTTTATYAVSGTKTTHTIKIDGGGNATSVTFASTQTSSNRFYIDNVSVVIGSGTYTLSPACCDINLVKPTVTTSSADQSVTVSWPSVKDAGVEAATAYEFTYKLASSSDDPTVVSVAATGAASYSRTITGLTNCSNYVFTVEAIGDPEAAITICSSPIASVTTYPGVAHTVNYQYGAGTGTPNVWVSGCSNGASTNLPAVTPNTLAYVFAGWYDGTTRVGGADDEYIPTADVTLVAQYSAAPTYTLTFVNEGAEILTKTVYSTAVENDRKATEPNANYTDYGLELTPLTTACSEAVFVGWTTAETVAQGTTTSPTLVTFPYTISGDATLYALWKITDTEGGGTATDFVKVTSTPSDWSGDYVIVSGTKAMKNTLSSGDMGASDVTISGGNTISNPDASIIWTFTNTGTDTYTAYNEAVSKYAYITGTSSSNAGLSTDAKNLTIGFKTAGDYDQIQLKGSGTTAARCFSYFSTNQVWRTYAASSNSTGSLYRRVAGTTTYYSSPACTPMITVDPADADELSCISAADLKVAVGGTATSTGHTVAARNCSGTSIVPVITGADRTAFSIDWTAKSLENGRADTVYTVLYKPLTGSEHFAQLQFKTDDGAVVSSIVNLCGTVCTSALFTTQSSTQSSITFAWSAPLSGASLRVWNDITGSPSCGPMPYDQTVELGTETSKTISGLSASTQFHYQITNGGCVSEVRNVTTTAAVGLPVLTASPTLWETMAEANRAATYTSTTINLTGANMPLANVSIALRGETAAFTLVPPATITLDGNGAGSIAVTYNPVKPQTNIAYIDLTYDSDCETKTVTITLVGNVPGIDIVEVNPDASGFTLHTDLEGTPNIVLSQEVEHQGSGRQANDLFFSKYFEAAQSTKLVGIYNGTNDTISLRGIRIGGHKVGKLTGTKAALWNPTEIISLDTLKSLAPGKEIILFSTTAGTQDKLVVNCVAGSTGWEHEGWYPVNDATAKAVYDDESRNLFINGKYDNKNVGIITAGDRVYGLQRKAVDGTWEFIDVIGALHSTAQGDSVIGRQIKPAGTVTGMDEPGWACMDGTNYLTKETAGLSTNRHLLIRKNTVVDGLNALEQNTEDFATLCTEWEGLIVPKGGAAGETEQDITCRHFGEVSTFNYDGYYASFERIDDNLVTFTAASGRPGDWVGSFLNPHDTFQDSLRCYNLKISVERYYDSRDVPPTERTKSYIQNLDPIDDAAEIAALDTVEVMSTQYRVPILVKSGDNLKTEDLRFTDLSKDTCKTCDVVILNNGILTKSSNVTDDRDSVRTVYVYNGGRLIVPDNLDFHVHDLQIRAKGDLVGAAYVQGNLLMKNPRIYHDKQIDNTKWYFFTLPYACDISKITEMNGKSLGVYGVTWGVKYYDGLSRVANRGLESNWKMLSYSETLEAGRGYIIQISSDIQKYVRFPMVADATFTEKNTAKTLDVTQYGESLANQGKLGYNNVGWNLVGNPYISYFTSATPEPEELGIDGVNNGTVELGGYYMRNPGGFNENTWTRLETSNIYVTIPNSNNIGYTQELSSLQQLDPFISFFVQAQATGTLTFATTSRDQTPSGVAARAKRTNETNRIALNLTVGTETDRTTILLDNYHTRSYEVGADLLKWTGSWAKLPYFYSFDDANNPLAFNAINYDEAKGTIPLAFYMPTSYARHTISIDRSRSKLEELEHVYLLKNGSIVADLLQVDYTNTNLKRAQANKEFAISIQRAAEVVTPVNPADDGSLMPYALTERHDVRVEQLPSEGSIVVLDAIGRTIANRRLTGDSSMTFNLPVDGVYTITVLTPARNYTLKTVIR